MTKIDRETVELARWYAEKTPKQRQLFMEFMRAVEAGRNVSKVEARVLENWIVQNHDPAGPPLARRLPAWPCAIVDARGRAALAAGVGQRPSRFTVRRPFVASANQPMPLPFPVGPSAD